ncbi:MAG: thermonuclease family protein [Gammaproteobacteria bacterium]|nr:thermonuclease family protein [Gammaproteobacteria bacterium]
MYVIKRTLLMFVCLLQLLATNTHAALLTGKVVGISDGDTITILTSEKEQIKIRLAEIDTPEKKQPYGQKAKQALSDKIYNQNVSVKVQTKDRYGRVIGHIYLGQRWINEEMIKDGNAWVYRQYSKSKHLLSLEQQAKAAKRGLWALPESQRQPPWEWRKQKKESKQGSDKKCGPKKYCKQMKSCAEAMRYLACGLADLDRDGDGVPCESLCK